MAASDSKAPLRTVKRVQFGILSPDECVSTFVNLDDLYLRRFQLCTHFTIIVVATYVGHRRGHSFFGDYGRWKT